MKKHIVIFGLLAILLIPALLVGCGGGVGSTQTSSTSIATTPSGTTTHTTSATASPSETSAAPTSVTTTTSAPSNNLNQILGEAANFPTVKYDMITTVSGQTITMTYWMKNKKIRMEMPDMGIITFMDMNEQTMYMYYPDQNMAIKMTFDASKAPENPSDILENSPKIVGTETIDGKVCTIIEYNSPEANVKTWIWNDKGFPVKMESTAGGVESTVLWKNFDFSDIPDSMFELPEGAQIMEIGG